MSDAEQEIGRLTLALAEAEKKAERDYLRFVDTDREEIERLRAELAAVTERMSKLDFERTAAELERDALRAENARLRAALKPFADDADCKFATYSNHYLRDAAAAIREGGKDEN